MRPGFDPWVGKIPWRRTWQPTPVFLPGESQGQRSLAGYCLCGHKELDTTERLCTEQHKPTLKTSSQDGPFIWKLVLDLPVFLISQLLITYLIKRCGFPEWHNSKQFTCQCRRCKRCRLDTWVGKITWSRKWQPNPVFLPSESREQRSLVGYSPWGCKESDMTEYTHTHTHTHTHIKRLVWDSLQHY